MKLNSGKTHFCTDIIQSSIKAYKWHSIEFPVYRKNIQKNLLLIYKHSILYKNSGSIISSLIQLNKRINPKTKIGNEDLEMLISLVVHIMSINSKTYPVGAALLSKFIAYIDKRHVYIASVEIPSSIILEIENLKAIVVQKINNAYEIGCCTVHTNNTKKFEMIKLQHGLNQVEFDDTKKMLDGINFDTTNGVEKYEDENKNKLLFALDKFICLETEYKGYAIRQAEVCDEIRKKLKFLPYRGYIEIWLQRITKFYVTEDKEMQSDEKLCKFVQSKKCNLKELWDNIDEKNISIINHTTGQKFKACINPRLEALLIS